jgi:hypothetical protein
LLHLCPKCNATLPAAASTLQQCPACGIYFAKYQAQQQVDIIFAEPSLTIWQRLLPEKSVGQWTLVGWALLWVLMVVWGAYLMDYDWRSGEIMNSFLHKPNLIFHEAGHVLFRPFGEFMSILGGSLFQCLLPLICLIAFLRRNDVIGGAACLWWCGENFLDVAPYIADARALNLPLIGESSDDMVAMRDLRHDWHNILGQLNLLPADIAIAHAAWLIGCGLMLLACVWLGVMIHRQWISR